MKTLRINQIITRQMRLEEELKKDTSFAGIRKYNAIHSFNSMYFQELEAEKRKNFETLKLKTRILK